MYQSLADPLLMVDLLLQSVIGQEEEYKEQYHLNRDYFDGLQGADEHILSARCWLATLANQGHKRQCVSRKNEKRLDAFLTHVDAHEKHKNYQVLYLEAKNIVEEVQCALAVVDYALAGGEGNRQPPKCLKNSKKGKGKRNKGKKGKKGE